MKMDVDGFFDSDLFDECITPSLEALDKASHIERMKARKIKRVKRALGSSP